MTITHNIETITPEKAQELLNKSASNRPLTKARVLRYANDMQDNDFPFQGQTIILDENNMLINGRHRCAACIMAKKPFKTLVVRGVERKNFTKIDIGKSWNAGDVLGADGFAQHRSIAAAVKIIRMISLMEQGVKKPGRKSYNWSSGFLSNDEILEFARKNRKELNAAAAAVRNTKTARKILAPHGVFIALFYLFAQRAAKKKVASFFVPLITGQNMHSSISQLRDIILKNKEDNYGFSSIEMTALTIKAWNAFVTNQKISKLTYNRTKEDWPIIKK